MEIFDDRQLLLENYRGIMKRTRWTMLLFILFVASVPLITALLKSTDIMLVRWDPYFMVVIGLSILTLGGSLVWPVLCFSIYQSGVLFYAFGLSFLLWRWRFQVKIYPLHYILELAAVVLACITSTYLTAGLINAIRFNKLKRAVKHI